PVVCTASSGSGVRCRSPRWSRPSPRLLPTNTGPSRHCPGGPRFGRAKPVRQSISNAFRGREPGRARGRPWVRLLSRWAWFRYRTRAGTSTLYTTLQALDRAETPRAHLGTVAFTRRTLMNEPVDSNPSTSSSPRARRGLLIAGAILGVLTLLIGA